MSTAMSGTPSPVRSGQMYGAFLLPSCSGQGAPSGSVSNGTRSGERIDDDRIGPHVARVGRPYGRDLLALAAVLVVVVDQSKTLINVLSVYPAVRGRTAIWFAIVWSLRPRSR